MSPHYGTMFQLSDLMAASGEFIEIKVHHYSYHRTFTSAWLCLAIWGCFKLCDTQAMHRFRTGLGRPRY